MDLTQLLDTQPQVARSLQLVDDKWPVQNGDSMDIDMEASCNGGLEALSDACYTIKTEEEKLFKLFYFPVKMSEIQIDLTEQLLALHRDEIITMVDFLNKTNGIKVVKEEAKLEKINAERDSLIQSLHLIDHSLKTITIHPYLLVDHYIPKNSLLKEPPERFEHASGKFEMLRVLIDVLQQPHLKDLNTQPQSANKKLNVVLVAQSGKELDLVEAFILGRKVNCVRITGTSLFSQPTTTTYHYSKASPKEHSKTKRGKGKHNLHKYKEEIPVKKVITDSLEYPTTFQLMSTSQLVSQFTLISDDIDLIISFDTSFDVKLFDNNLAGFRLPIPVIRLITYNSIDHGFVYFQQLAHFSEEDLKLKALLVAVQSRGEYVKFSKNQNNQKKDENLLINKLISIPNVLKNILNHKYLGKEENDKFTNLPTFNPIFKDKVERAFNENYSVNFDPDNDEDDDDDYTNNNKRLKIDTSLALDYKDDSGINSTIFETSQVRNQHYKQVLTKQLNENLTELKKVVEKQKEALKPLQERESIRQNEIDSTNLRTADLYQKWQVLGNEIKHEDKKNERQELDYQRALNRYEKKKELWNRYREVANGNSKIDSIKMEEQEVKKADLKKRIKEVEELLDKLGKENDKSREQYRDKSLESLKLNGELKDIKVQHTTLIDKLKNADLSIKLKTLYLEEQKEMKEEEVKRLNSDIGFLKHHTATLGDILRERNNLLSNGRGCSGHNTRSSTPHGYQNPQSSSSRSNSPPT